MKFEALLIEVENPFLWMSRIGRPRRPNNRGSSKLSPHSGTTRDERTFNDDYEHRETLPKILTASWLNFYL
jgi:hypothetical protein